MPLRQWSRPVPRGSAVVASGPQLLVPVRSAVGSTPRETAMDADKADECIINKLANGPFCINNHNSSICTRIVGALSVTKVLAPVLQEEHGLHLPEQAGIKREELG
ncbi:uncharacterized protein BDW47DRAFT_104858 [Aspergillus candidus]|uniref:Uncharacterized protein n=1 Tax=Aspergillus candidus TaxID=41067 RepID=A0A2I2FCT4_ASPCN|nr:hypothetical protein BDW47DRAFT_104858 [Aspergillus candidus]PLB38445.1 hypothetical protein BDW47DRAFT_104858 [Aspergillus candidus]